MAEAILRARLAARGIAAEVNSVGTLGWSGRPATPKAVDVMAAMGLDISAHRSRRIEPAHLDVDLVLAMTRDHAGAVIARDEAARPRVFLPSELVRLLRSTPREVPDEAPDGGTRAGVAQQILGLGALRQGAIGRAAEEVADPAGESVDVYRVTAQRLDRDITGLVDAFWS